MTLIPTKFKSAVLALPFWLNLFMH